MKNILKKRPIFNTIIIFEVIVILIGFAFFLRKVLLFPTESVIVFLSIIVLNIAPALIAGLKTKHTYKKSKKNKLKAKELISNIFNPKYFVKAVNFIVITNFSFLIGYSFFKSDYILISVCLFSISIYFSYKLIPLYRRIEISFDEKNSKEI